jgi:hypothetical protein
MFDVMHHEAFGLVARRAMAGSLAWTTRQPEDLMVNEQTDALPVRETSP